MRKKNKESICKIAEEIYEKIAKEYGNYLNALKAFEQITEGVVRRAIEEIIKHGRDISQRSLDQAWKNCKGQLYEKAVYKALEEIIKSDEDLNNKFLVIRNPKEVHKKQIAIHNWSEIYPDADILIVERASNRVKVVISCKTSLRERLTETAFWKRELEFSNIRDVKIIFITTNKDNELEKEQNRYIVHHVLDGVVITDKQKYEELIKEYQVKYKGKQLNELLSKIKFIDDFRHLLI